MKPRQSRTFGSRAGALLLLILISAITRRGDRRIKTATISEMPRKPRRGRAVVALLVSPIFVVVFSLLIYLRGCDSGFGADLLAFSSDVGTVLAFTGAMAALAHHHFSASSVELNDAETQHTWDWFMLLSLGVAAIGGLMLALDGGVGLLDRFFGPRCS